MMREQTLIPGIATRLFFVKLIDTQVDANIHKAIACKYLSNNRRERGSTHAINKKGPVRAIVEGDLFLFFSFLFFPFLFFSFLFFSFLFFSFLNQKSCLKIKMFAGKRCFLR